MSWKSLVTTGLFCLLAAPAFAAPSMALVSGGTLAGGKLNAQGQWTWTVTATPDLGLVPDSSGTPLAIEAGFTGTTTGVASGQGNVLSATRNPANGTGSFDTINPGGAIFGTWQTGALLDAGSNNRPTGIQTNCVSGTCSTGNFPTNAAGESYAVNSSVAGAANQVFAALGSVNFTTAGAKNVMNITIQRPVVTTANPVTTTSIKVSGIYGTGSTNARLTQVTGLSSGVYTTSNFDTFASTYTMTAKGGDADLNGTVNFADYSAVTGNYNVAGTFRWDQGDFDGNGVVNFADYSMVTANYLVAAYNYNAGVVVSGAGSGSGLEGASVPEPASVAMIGLAVLGGLGVVRRKR